MKRLFILFSVAFLTFAAFGQKTEKYTENDVKQFYRTIQGDYTGQLNDSTTLRLHLTPIWGSQGNSFQWLYMEVTDNGTNAVIEQKIVEIKPISDFSFKVVVHGINHPEQFAGKWANRNYFDGFNSSILKGKGKYTFLKTVDFEYQTGWNSRKNLKCFPSGDRIHFKFVQEEERLYVKRVPKRSSNIIGITFFKDLTD